MATASGSDDHAPLALIADRDAATRQLYVRHLFRTCGTVEAQDGAEALATVFLQHPDIVITDTQLGGISGIQLCRLLRADVSTHSIPIVVVTRDISHDAVARAEACGADAVLVKPFLPDQLRNEIHWLLKESVVRRDRERSIRERPPEQIASADGHLRKSRNTCWSLFADERPDGMTDRPTTKGKPCCPICHGTLRYVSSHPGAVLFKGEWDYFDCHAGCGTFQFGHRTGTS